MNILDKIKQAFYGKSVKTQAEIEAEHKAKAEADKARAEAEQKAKDEAERAKAEAEHKRNQQKNPDFEVEEPSDTGSLLYRIHDKRSGIDYEIHARKSGKDAYEELLGKSPSEGTRDELLGSRVQDWVGFYDPEMELTLKVKKNGIENEKLEQSVKIKHQGEQERGLPVEMYNKLQAEAKSSDAGKQQTAKLMLGFLEIADDRYILGTGKERYNAKLKENAETQADMYAFGIRLRNGEVVHSAEEMHESLRRNKSNVLKEVLAKERKAEEAREQADRQTALQKATETKKELSEAVKNIDPDTFFKAVQASKANTK